MTKSWEEHKETIITQYKENNKPLHEVQRFMEDRHGFKASTRAYRSRFDKWGVHKYSCRKRKGSDEAEQGGSHSEYPDSDDRPPHSHSPEEERQYVYHHGGGDEADSSPSSISPSSSSHDRHYYGTTGTTPPSDLGSPNIKFESTYHHHAPMTPPSLRHPLAPPQGYLADPHHGYGYGYGHHHHHHYGTQPTAAGDGYYRTAAAAAAGGEAQHVYLQAPTGMDMGVHHGHYGGGYEGGER